MNNPPSLFLFDMEMDSICKALALQAFDIICKNIGLSDIEE